MVTQTGTQTSPEAIKGHFSIGASGNKEENIRLSPKLTRKDRSNKQLRSKRERAMSPAPAMKDRNLSLRDRTGKEPTKEAISPSVAECLRAIFAAFLWHEGIVHDAMACASFLKFHPSLPKQGAIVVTRHPSDKSDKHDALTKEQKARQRHSVEVSTSTYLHIQPATLETLTKSAANANANRNKSKKHSDAIKEEGAGSDSPSGTKGSNKLTSLPETSFHTVAVLPPALKSLVFLWEELTTNCLRAIMQQVILPSPTLPPKIKKFEKSKDKEREKDKKSRKKKEWKPMARANLFGEVNAAAFGGIEHETMCELCGNFYPHPVTYHMRQSHPGCGGRAGGKGYNSGGNFCVGWAGNCGDGGIGGSSWYLICDQCREKYLRQKKQTAPKEKKKTKKKSGSASSSKLLSPVAQLETHIIMKNNAMFLLDLASAASPNLPGQGLSSKRSPYSSMPSVSEHSPADSDPFPAIPFQCLQALGVHQSQLQMINEEQILEETLRQNGEHGLDRLLEGAGLVQENGPSQLSASVGRVRGHKYFITVHVVSS